VLDEHVGGSPVEGEVRTNGDASAAGGPNHAPGKVRSESRPVKGHAHTHLC
jgi:hypothetical protein